MYMFFFIYFIKNVYLVLFNFILHIAQILYPTMQNCKMQNSKETKQKKYPVYALQ